MSQHRKERTKELDRKKKKTEADPEAPGKRDEAFSQEEIGKRRKTIKKVLKYEG